MSDFRKFDPAELERKPLFDLMRGCIVPRPIGWTSTASASGATNLAPFSFFTMVCLVPPMISLTISRKRDGSEKDSLRNIRETGEFCVNVATLPYWERVVDSANGLPADESEFDTYGLTAVPADKVKAPRVKESPVTLECRLERVIELGPSRHPVVFGEVVLFHVDAAVMTGPLIDMDKLQPVGHLCGPFYCGLGEIMERSFQT